MNIKSIKHTKGFTLIELLVTISIITLLSTVIAARLIDAKKKAADANIIVQARQLYKAVEMYYDSNQKFPDAVPNVSGGWAVIPTTGTTTKFMSNLVEGGFMPTDMKIPKGLYFYYRLGNSGTFCTNNPPPEAIIHFYTYGPPKDPRENCGGYNQPHPTVGIYANCLCLR